MPVITSSYIKKELNKIAFLIHYAGMFDEFGAKIRNTLEELPVEWESVQTDGKVVLSATPQEEIQDENQALPPSEEAKPGDETHQYQTTWKEADLVGKLNDKPLKLKIKREFGKDDKTQKTEVKRIIYRIAYEGRWYSVSSLPKLKDAIEKLSAGQVPKPKLMQMTYDLIQSKKAEVYTYIKRNYLMSVSRDVWYYSVKKDASRIYIRFYNKVDDPQKKKEIEDKLTEHNNYRLDSIGSYLETLISGEGISGITKENMTHTIIKLSDEAGFVITIK